MWLQAEFGHLQTEVCATGEASGLVLVGHAWGCQSEGRLMQIDPHYRQQPR